MDTQTIVQDAIRDGSTAESHLLRGRNLDTAEALARVEETDASITNVLAGVPGVNLAFRVLKNWQEELSPRVYGDEAILVTTEPQEQPGDRPAA